MFMWKCKHCNNTFDYERTTEKANHSRWCERNPKAKLLREENSQRRLMAAQLKFGKVKRFKVVCANCEKDFEVDEREKLFPQKVEYFCNRSCSNHRGSGLDWAKLRNVELTQYKTICFAHHEKKCVICEEKNIIAVHHYNEDHYDNRPENLVPMCPTHHEYMHSSFKYLVEDTVDNYVNDYVRSLGP